MNQSILDLRAKLDSALASVAEIAALEALKVEYLGKKGSITALMKNMGSLSPEEKKSFGKEVNELKDYATEAVAQKYEALQQLQLQKELDELKKAPPAAEISEEEIERIKAEAIADIKKKHEAELVQIRIDGEQEVSDVRAEAEAEAERRIEEMKQKLIAASDDTVKVVSVLTEQVSELLTKITERVQGAPDEVKAKLSGAVCRLLTAAAESFNN